MKKSLFWLLALVLSPVAVLVVITPMDSQKQYIFGLLSIGILFLMGRTAQKSARLAFAISFAGHHLQQLSGSAADLHLWFPYHLGRV